jgi:hypothetical protein
MQVQQWNVDDQHQGQRRCRCSQPYQTFGASIPASTWPTMRNVNRQRYLSGPPHRAYHGLPSSRIIAQLGQNMHIDHGCYTYSAHHAWLSWQSRGTNYRYCIPSHSNQLTHPKKLLTNDHHDSCNTQIIKETPHLHLIEGTIFFAFFKRN